MLASMTAGQFAEWCLYDELEPIGQQSVCEVVSALAVIIAGYLGVNTEGGEPLSKRHFMWWTKGQEESTRFVSPEQAAKQFAEGAGRGTRRR
jgi:hypothetical protein